MKWLVCEKLARCLRFGVPARTPTLAVICSANVSNDVGDFKHDGEQQVIPSGTVEKLLMELIELQRSQIKSKADDADKSDGNEENKNDWKLAAAVIDRILLIIFSISFFGGTIIFAAIVGCVYFSFLQFE